MHFLSNLFKKEEYTPHEWKIHTTTKDALDALYASFEKAKESIYLETYLFTPDAIGDRFLKLFEEKARQGVHVRILVDSIGSLPLGKSVYLESLNKAGVKIKFFNWLFPFSKYNKKLWYFRNHRRIALIDKEKVFCGGFCISKKMEEWRETTLEIAGPVVDQAVLVAEKTWKKVYKKRYINLGREWRTGIGSFSFITHAPLLGERHLYHTFVDAIRQAKKSIYITTPYFVPDHRIYRVLRLAEKRGVDVRIILPEKSNYKIIDHAAHTYFHNFLSKGIRIYQYHKMIHAKTAVIDGEWSMIGTLNMDNVSLRYNFECAIVSTDTECAKKMNEIFMEDIKHTKEVELRAWDNRPLIDKCKDLITWPIRKFL
jgi:cardiolipin synthase